MRPVGQLRPPYYQLRDPDQRRALVFPAQKVGPASKTAAGSRTWAGVSLHRAPSGPFEVSAWPPAASARRHRFADIRNRLAISWSLGLASISSAAASRTCSQRPSGRSPAPDYPPR